MSYPQLAIIIDEIVTNDNILGNDGSIVSASNGAYPAKLQGIEYSVGGYETYADVILKHYNRDDGVGVSEPYVVSDITKQATSITENYQATEMQCVQPDVDNWDCIKKLER